jgi:hypothetical protein
MRFRAGTALYVGMQARVLARTEDSRVSAPSRKGAAIERRSLGRLRSCEHSAPRCRRVQIAGFDGGIYGLRERQQIDSRGLHTSKGNLRYVYTDPATEEFLLRIAPNATSPPLQLIPRSLECLKTRKGSRGVAMAVAPHSSKALTPLDGLERIARSGERS